MLDTLILTVIITQTTVWISESIMAQLRSPRLGVERLPQCSGRCISISRLGELARMKLIQVGDAYAETCAHCSECVDAISIKRTRSGQKAVRFVTNVAFVKSFENSRLHGIQHSSPRKYLESMEDGPTLPTRRCNRHCCCCDERYLP